MLLFATPLPVLGITIIITPTTIIIIAFLLLLVEGNFFFTCLPVCDLSFTRVITDGLNG